VGQLWCLISTFCVLRSGGGRRRFICHYTISHVIILFHMSLDYLICHYTILYVIILFHHIHEITLDITFWFIMMIESSSRPCLKILSALNDQNHHYINMSVKKRPIIYIDYLIFFRLPMLGHVTAERQSCHIIEKSHKCHFHFKLVGMDGRTKIDVTMIRNKLLPTRKR